MLRKEEVSTMKVLRHLVATAATVFALAGAAPSTASAQLGAEVSITVAPPALQSETISASPGAEYVWQRGEWTWSPERGGYLWHPGRWVLHPEGQTVWHPSEWILFNGGWRYLPGHWRGAAEPPPPEAARRVQVTVAPPADRVEVIPVRPSPAYSWIHGHWSWDGSGYRWVGGHWGFVPRESHEWVHGHWYRSGNYYFYASGYWH
jgi:hypothetical protein